jgi:hypothetical protein
MSILTRRQVSFALAACGAGVFGRGAQAHHGWGGYDSEKVLTLEGTILECKYTNPHGELRVQVADKVWVATLAPPFRMQNRGLTAEMMKVGTRCTVVGYPSKSDPGEMRAERITVAGKTVELR